MPPFRKGLLKRKLTETPESKLNEVESDERSGSESGYALLPEELNLRDADTDSEDEPRGDVHTGHPVSLSLHKAFAAEDDRTLAAGASVGDESEQSSELTDSEGSDESGRTDDDEGDGDDDASSPGHTTLGPKPDTNTNKGDATSIDKLADSIENTRVSIRPVAQQEEYDSGDTSDEEDRRNTAGDVPMWWYNEYPHVGYDLDGRKIMRPPQRDHIDQFLKQCEDPEFWRTVRDPATGQDVVLSAEDLELIRRLREGRAPADSDPYQPWVEWFTREPLPAPLRAFPDHKRSFLPSRDERRRVARIVHALNMGWMKTRRTLAAERRERKEKRFYDLWGSSADGEGRAGLPTARHIPAPRRAPPAHAESYNPPPEYLLDADETRQWEALAETPWKRKYTFLPRRHASLRAVGAHERFARERFLRCLDLYLAPRAIKMRLDVRAEELVPRLPAPRDLRPFPSAEAVVFRGHAGAVRAAAFDPSGQYVASGGEDGTVRVWEAHTGRCLRTVRLAAAVAAVAWVPAGGLSLVAAAAGARLLLLNPGADVGLARAAAATDELLRAGGDAGGGGGDARVAAAASWDAVSPEEWARGVRLAVSHARPVARLAWHARGDYLAATLQEGGARAVLVHQVSRRRSQLPLARAPGLVQCAEFHPSRPQLFVATQRSVHVYDLVRRERTRTLRAGVQWISCMALHPGGEHLVVGSYDRRLVWFDLELSARPYRALRLHGGAVRSVAVHARYPLFASGGDDRHAVVSHGAVFADLERGPLLVPLKRLAGGARRGAHCVLQVAWHPTRPWLLAACADSTLRLYS